MLYWFIMMFSSAKNVLDNLEEINTIVNKSTKKKKSGLKTVFILDRVPLKL